LLSSSDDFDLFIVFIVRAVPQWSIALPIAVIDEDLFMSSHGFDRSNAFDLSKARVMVKGVIDRIVQGMVVRFVTQRRAVNAI